MVVITDRVGQQYRKEGFALIAQEFASYFESQNAAIAKGTVTGQNISLVALGISDGWYDPITQYKAYVDFSYNNTYKSLISSSQHTSYLDTYNSKCLPLLQECTSTTGSNSACETADSTCYNDIEGPLSEIADFDVYDIREPSNDAFPPETYVTYLQSSAVMSAIGAQSTYSECPDAPYEKFTNTGDGSSHSVSSTGFGSNE
jgi:carboxypeptidase C (cathepsin A)